MIHGCYAMYVFFPSTKNAQNSQDPYYKEKLRNKSKICLLEPGVNLEFKFRGHGI